MARATRESSDGAGRASSAKPCATEQTRIAWTKRLVVEQVTLTKLRLKFSPSTLPRVRARQDDLACDTANRSNLKTQMRILAFLDTEFTGLGKTPVLLSVGIVLGVGDKREFYAEVTDTDRLAAAEAFTADTVLTQFGRIAGAGCAYAALVVRLRAFLLGLASTQAPGSVVELAFNSDIDWMLVRQALKDDSELSLARIAHFIRPTNIYNMAGFAAGEFAANSYFAAQQSAPIHRHHALCDARALRVAYTAARAACAAQRPQQRIHS